MIDLPVAEAGMILGSYILLLLTCVEHSPVRELAVLAWLGSLGLVVLRNTGAAFGLYVAAVAHYAVLFYPGAFSLFDRPDHPALVLLVGSLLFVRSRVLSEWPLDRIAVAIIVFLGYGVANGFLTGSFSSGSVAQFGRALGIPLVLLVLIMNSGPTRRDLWSFFFVMFILAFHDAVVSLMWQVEALRPFSFPPWITDPEISQRVLGGRSGGLLMQPASNGLLLSLIFCMVYLAYHRWIIGHGRVLLLILGGVVLAAIYFSYSRAVYLGTLAAVIGLLWVRAGGASAVVVRRVVLVLLAALGLALAFAVRPAKLEERIGNEQTAVWRIEIWNVAVNMIRSQPLFGFGFRGYGENAYRFLDDSDVLDQHLLEKNQPAVHNIFLNIAVELGLVGFVVYVLLHLFIFQRAAARMVGPFGVLGVVWLLAFAADYFIQGQFAVPQEPTATLTFYGTLGLLAGMSWTGVNNVLGYSVHDRTNPFKKPEWSGQIPK